MPLTKDQAIAIIIDAINKGTVHANYKRVNALNKLYLSLITGEGVDDLLKRFELREDADAFKQRLELTTSTTDALCGSIFSPFEKVLRTEPLVRRIHSKDEAAVAVINEKLQIFYGSENQSSGLDYYFQTRFKDLTFTDPNAFIMLEWDAFDHNQEKASPYPYEISCHQAINYSYHNNKLEFLLDKRPNTYLEADEVKSGDKYTLYFVGYALVFNQVGSKYIAEEGEEIYTAENEKRFAVQLYETRLTAVPAIGTGYIPDKKTKGITYVNPFHNAINYFRKIVKQISEADLSKTLHAFPQKFQYVQNCPGEDTKNCIQGKTLDGHICRTCNGKGYAFHTSAQDAIIMPLPRKKEDAYDLDSLMVYKTPPIDLLKFQEEIIDKYETKIIDAVFNPQAIVKKSTVKTATEVEHNMDYVYDTLHPFAEKISTSWEQLVALVAEITDTYQDDLVIAHRYPSDFKLKTLSQLMADLKAANDSGAPSFVRSKINSDIAEQTYIDQPDELVKYKVQQRFYPFSGKTVDEIGLLMVQDFTPFSVKLLYANFDLLFKKAEKENLSFYELSEEKQTTIIDKYIAELEAELKPKAIAFNPLA